MTEDHVASSLITAGAVALQEGERVSIRFDGQEGWIEVTELHLSRWGPGVIEARRAADGRRLLIATSRLASVDVGQSKP